MFFSFRIHGGDIFDNFHKFFVAKVDFQTTTLRVRGYFARFGNVNHIKLIPHRASDNGEGHGRHGAIRGQKYLRFLFVMDHESAVAVERYVGAFPNN